MNFNTMDCIKVGMIVEDVDASKILYINETAKNILKIADISGGDASTITDIRQFFSNIETYNELRTRIIKDMKLHNKSEGIAYLKTLENTFVEVNFSCVWEDVEKRTVSYIFQSATEVLDEKQLSFKELTEHLPNGIVVMDIENKLAITYANPEHYKILGIEFENNVPQKNFLLKDFIFDEDVDWVLSEIYISLAKNEDVDIEFRMITNYDKVKWVRLFGRANVSSTGERLFYSSLKDLSQRKKIYDKLHLERVLFNKMTVLTKERLFKVDLKTNIIHFLGKNDNAFEDLNILENYPEKLEKLYPIHEDDSDVYKEMLECFNKGIERPAEIRYKSSNGEFEWHRIDFKFIRDNDENPISVLGKVANIHSAKLLEEQSKSDALTGLHNAVTTKHEIDSLINFRKDMTHAFFTIDLDNFKKINDDLGHHFGDMVLSSIAEEFKSCFRKNDILGRMKGDEFVIVMSDIKDTAIIMERAEYICNIFHKTFMHNHDVNISASIGVSIYPDDGNTFEELYKKSKIALYEIKKTGKDGFRRYLGDLKDINDSFVSTELDGNRSQPIRMNNMIISTILNLLYESQNLNTTIDDILEYIGTMFKVDRCYIFEAVENGMLYSNTYKWYKNGEYENRTKTVPYTNLADVFKATNIDGVFYSSEIETIESKDIVRILKSESAKSVFFVDSLKSDNDNMFLGVEDCQLKRAWSEEEIITLLHIGRLLFTAISNNNIIAKLCEADKKNETAKRFQTIENKQISDTDITGLTDIIYDFYDEKDDAISTLNTFKNVCHLLKIDKVSTTIYDEKEARYRKLYEYTINETTNKYPIELLSKGAGNFLDTLNYCNDEHRTAFLNLFNEQRFIHTNDYTKIKEVLKTVGFVSENEDNISEIYIYANNHKSMFGYVIFELYNDTENRQNPLSNTEVDVLSIICKTINSRVRNFELLEGYRNEIMMKDVILKNEKTPMIVVEKDTYKIIYYNELYYNIFPTISLGSVCYELLGNSDKCVDCCMEKDLLMSDSNRIDHQWIKKAVPFKLRNGKDVYMVYSKDSIDYIKQINLVDNLTQALLRRGFEEHYKNIITKNIYKYALCTLDIDKFKYINEIFDYQTGDSVLRKVAQVIRDFINNDENFCRLNEDKFAIFISYTDEVQLNSKLELLCDKFDEMRMENFPHIKITITCGVTIVNKTADINTLLDQCTIARKMIKGSHKNKFNYYNKEANQKIKTEVCLEERVPTAIANDEFVPFLQPKFDLQTKKISGAEALVRWIAEDGMIFPDQFIPLFEKNGFITTLDFIIYEKVICYIRSCLDRGLPVYTISVNVSRNHIKNKNFSNDFMRIMTKYNVPTKYLELEITESVFVEDSHSLKDFVDSIKKNDLKISIDDFGSAYSSLQNLTEIDIDTLKIDKGFLDNIDLNAEVTTKDEIVVKNIINLAKDLNFSVICEGIEEEAQIELLKNIGCEYGQGYVFSKPISISDYEELYLK